MGDAETGRTFHWDEARDLLPDFGEFELDETGRLFSGRSDDGQKVHITPPLVWPRITTRTGRDATRLRDLLDSLPFAPGPQLVVLLQAGAAAIGYFDEGESVRTKSIKKYVVRGRGKAQPTYLESKGKSRYGSRLRLQNAKALLEETNEKMREWVDEFGPPDQVFYSCNVRSWPELFRANPTPPFDRDDPLIKLPWDLPVPTTDVLLRTYKRMSYGRIDYENA